MLIRCPSCAFGFELAEESLGVKASVSCPACSRRVVVRDAEAVPPGGDVTMPLQAWTEVALPPARPEELTEDARFKMPRGKRVALALLAGPGKGNLYRIDRPRVVLGRWGGQAAIEVDDPEISRSHAALECHSARIVLRDLGSRNGTFVDERRIQEEALRDGAEFRLGRTRFMLVLSDSG